MTAPGPRLRHASLLLGVEGTAELVSERFLGIPSLPTRAWRENCDKKSGHQCMFSRLSTSKIKLQVNCRLSVPSCVSARNNKVAAVLSTTLERADRRHQELLRREDRPLFSLARALHHLVRAWTSERRLTILQGGALRLE